MNLNVNPTVDVDLDGHRAAAPGGGRTSAVETGWSAGRSRTTGRTVDVHGTVDVDLDGHRAAASVGAYLRG